MIMICILPVRVKEQPEMFWSQLTESIKYGLLVFVPSDHGTYLDYVKTPTNWYDQRTRLLEWFCFCSQLKTADNKLNGSGGIILVPYSNPTQTCTLCISYFQHNSCQVGSLIVLLVHVSWGWKVPPQKCPLGTVCSYWLQTVCQLGTNSIPSHNTWSHLVKDPLGTQQES